MSAAISPDFVPVVGLETAKRLAAAGYDYPSERLWLVYEGNIPMIIRRTEIIALRERFETYPAYTKSELWKAVVRRSRRRPEWKESVG